MADAAEKFVFGADFDGVGAAPARPRRLYPVEEVDQIREAARAEGERQALAGIAARQANALAEIAAACNQALPKLAGVAHDHREASAELALACARAIADAALAAFPTAVIHAALDALAREIEAQPRLIVSAEPELALALQVELESAARRVGFDGAIVVRAEASMGTHAFALDFGDGQAAYDPAAAAERVGEALRAALAAEGLHAEPLIPGTEA